MFQKVLLYFKDFRAEKKPQENRITYTEKVYHKSGQKSMFTEHLIKELAK